jgi:hypothetical protein
MSWDFGQDMRDLGALTDEEQMELIPESDWLDFEVSVRDVLITDITRKKIERAMEEAPRNMEWAGFMERVGWKDDNPVYGNLEIPEQVPRSGTVEFQVEDPGYGKPVAIHSHHTMGTFHSGTDDCGVDANNDVSIVVSWPKGPGTELKYGARVRVKTGTDEIIRSMTGLKTVPAGNGLSDFVKEFNDKLKTSRSGPAIGVGSQLDSRAQRGG